MDPISLLGLGSVANFVGGLFNTNAQQQANQANLQFAQQQMAQNQYDLANSVSIRVADAKNAGINPLAALGAPMLTLPPVSAGQEPVTGMGSALQNMGQNISRSSRSLASPEQKMADSASTAMQLRSMDLDNQIKEAHLMSLHRTANAPGTPAGVVPPELNTPPWEVRPTKVDPFNEWGTQAGVGPSKLVTKNADGTYSVTYAHDAQQAGFEGTIGKWQDDLAHRVLPEWAGGIWDMPRDHYGYNMLTGTYHDRTDFEKFIDKWVPERKNLTDHWGF